MDSSIRSFPFPALLLALVWVTPLRAADPEFLGKFPASGSTPNRFYGVSASGQDIVTVTYGYSPTEVDTNGAIRLLTGVTPPAELLWDSPFNGFRKVEVGDHIYVLSSFNGAGNWRTNIHIFDKASLAKFDTDNRVMMIGTEAYGLGRDGTVLYIGSDDGLIAIDAADPDYESGDPSSGPQYLGAYPGVTNGYDVEFYDGLVFVADGTAGLKIIDFSNPSSPVLVGSWDPGSGKTARGVTVTEVGTQTVACVVGNGFWTVDVSSPDAPVSLDAEDEDLERVTAANGLAYAAGDYGMRIYDISDPADIQFEGRYISSSQGYDIAYSAPFIYLACYNGLYALRHGTAPGMTLALSVDPEAGDAPLDCRLEADLTGGTPPYTFNWFINGVLVDSGPESYHDHVFEEAALNTVHVTATDGMDQAASAAKNVDSRGFKPRLHGVVTEVDTGHAIGSASLLVQAADGSTSRADTVNTAGQYKFPGLEPAIYRVTATAPDYHSQTRTVALRPGDNRELNIALAGVLSDEAVQKKENIIVALTRFPDDDLDWDADSTIAWLAHTTGFRASVLEHRFEEAEDATAIWLYAQTTQTEALQRLTLAESAFHTLSGHSVLYARNVAHYQAAVLSNGLDFTLSLFQLNNTIRTKYWYLDLHGSLIQRLAKLSSRKMFLAIAWGTGERVELAARQIFANALEYALTEFAHYTDVDINRYVLDWKARLAQLFTQALVDEYAKTTAPLLSTALSAAEAGGPYPGLEPYEDARAHVLGELRSAANQHQIILKYQPGIEGVAEGADRVFGGFFSLLGSILGNSPEHSGERGLAYVAELAFRGQRMWANNINAEMALHQLQDRLPQAAANVVYLSFSQTAPPFPDTPAGEAPPAPMPEPDGPTDNYELPIPVPSSAAARAHIVTAKAELETSDFSGYGTTLDTGLAPALDAYLEDSSRLLSAGDLFLDAGHTALDELEAQLTQCIGSYEYILAGSLDLLMHIHAGYSATAADAETLRQDLIARLTTLDATLGFADAAAAAMIAGLTDQPAPGAVVAITGIRVQNSDGESALPREAGQTLTVTATVNNPGNATSSGVQATLSLDSAPSLLAPATPTQALPALDPGASAETTWNLTASGDAYQSLALLSVELTHSGGDTSTRLPSTPSSAVIPGYFYADGDGDGIADSFENSNGLNPSDPGDADSDTDGDTLTALDEFLGHTNPGSSDTDGDGTSDLDELVGGYNPHDANSHPIPTPDQDELEVALFDGGGTQVPLLRANFLKPDPTLPLTIQSSTNLVDWSDLMVYSGSASLADPAIFRHTEHDGHYELLFDAHGFDPDPPAEAFYRLASPTPSGWDFTYSYNDPGTSHAQQYIVQTSNARVYTEANYRMWVPNVGGATYAGSSPGIIVYRFDFEDNIHAAEVSLRSHTFHWNYSRGHNRFFFSKDGTNWEQVAETLPPVYGATNGGYPPFTVQPSVLGGTSLWIKAELVAYGPSAHLGGALTNTAEHSRCDTNNLSNPVFSVKVQLAH